jgi:uncharacterized cupin superfamily protein
MILPWVRRRSSGLARRAAAHFRRSGTEACTAGLGALCAHRYDSEVPRMNRQNLFSDEWDGENEEVATRHRIFWRPDDAGMGGTLYELPPDAPETRMHMHFGAEEMFFVLSGRPLFRNQHGKEHLSPGDVVFCPEGRAGLHTFSNPTEEPARILAVSAGSFPDVVAYPEHGCAWVATRSRSRATRERRRPRHHRSLRDPDRVTARPSPDPKGPWERPLLLPGSAWIRERSPCRPRWGSRGCFKEPGASTSLALPHGAQSSFELAAEARARKRGTT